MPNEKASFSSRFGTVKIQILYMSHGRFPKSGTLQIQIDGSKGKAPTFYPGFTSQRAAYRVKWVIFLF